MHNGQWVFRDPSRNREIPLEPLFEKCCWNLEELSCALGLGQRTLARVIEKNIGIPGKVWLRQIRVVRAEHLLREGLKIEHLSYKLGFHHKADFTHEFRKLVGVSPSSFVKAEIQRMFPPHYRH